MRKPFDYPLFLTTLLLVAIGLTMVFSASGVLAKEKLGDSTFFLKREIIAALIGFAALFLVRMLPLKVLSRAVYPLLFVTLVLLTLVLIPSIGTKVGGASRWLRIGPISLQPSEMAKIVLVLFLADIASRKRERITELKGILSPMIVSGLLIGLVLMGKDLGAAVVMGLTLITILFASGVRPAVIVSEILLALPALYYLVFAVPYRRARILAFLNPWAHEREAGFQIIQSFVAFHAGSFFGLGLGEGRQKLFYLPEAHTDFILSVIGEELGLLGTLAVLTLMGVWLYRAFRITWSAPDLFSSLVSLGIAALIGFQAFLNIAVVTGLLPTKGLTLPFVSYGGSSLLFSLIGVGILLNISARGQRV